MARLEAAEAFVLLPALVVLVSDALLVVLLFAAGFAFAAALLTLGFAVELFAAEDFDAGLAVLLTPLASPLESASITMDGAALDEAALDEAALGWADLLAAGLMRIGMVRVYGINSVNWNATKLGLAAHHRDRISHKQGCSRFRSVIVIRLVGSGQGQGCQGRSQTGRPSG